MNIILFHEQARQYTLEHDDPRFQHINHVLKAVEGTELRVGVINGKTGTGVVTERSPHHLAMSVSWQDGKPLASLPVTVVLGHPRPPVLKRLWRDLAALGVQEIRVFHGELGERSYGTSSAWDNPARWLTEGVSQGGHTMLPDLSRYGNLREALNRDAFESESPAGRFYGGMKRTGAILPTEISGDSREVSRARVCVGPERGFTPDEERTLGEYGYHPVYLGPRTLRTETAAVIMTSIAAVLVESHRW